MELKNNVKEALIKASKKDVNYILTHGGFINNCDLSESEINLLHDLAKEINKKNIVIVIDDKAFTTYMSGYNGGYTIAGIKINSIVS